jgi:uncharacterized cupin superfamily protein
MSGIIIEHHIDDKKREDLKVVTWPLWAMEPTTYTKKYEMPESVYVEDGLAILTGEDLSPAELNQGCLITIPAGVELTWEIRKTLKKRYLLG